MIMCSLCDFPGALLTVRTVGVLTITTLATSMAAREGPIQMAGFQICFEVWLALSLLNDALALAGQVPHHTLSEIMDIRRYGYRLIMDTILSQFNIVFPLIIIGLVTATCLALH